MTPTIFQETLLRHIYTYLAGLQDVDLFFIHGVPVLFQEAITLILNLKEQIHMYINTPKNVLIPYLGFFFFKAKQSGHQNQLDNISRLQKADAALCAVKRCHFYIRLTVIIYFTLFLTVSCYYRSFLEVAPLLHR